MFLKFIQGKSVFVPWIVWAAVSAVHLLAAYQFGKNDASSGETGSIWWLSVDVFPRIFAIFDASFLVFFTNPMRAHPKPCENDSINKAHTTWYCTNIYNNIRAIACTALHGLSQNCKRIGKANYVCKLKVIWSSNFTQKAGFLPEMWTAKNWTRANASTSVRWSPWADSQIFSWNVAALIWL